MMIMASFLFPSSLFVAAASAVLFLTFVFLGLSEFKGNHLQYSKFSKIRSDNGRRMEVSGRTGMIVLYAPAFLACAASFAIFPGENLRFLVLKSALTVHFFKRVFEAVFIHKYSGEMPIDSMILISSTYFISSVMLISSQYLSQGLQEPSFNLQNIGTILFLLGILGNFYHHFLLSKLRGKGEKGYKIPRGGLFGLVICPHYLFEIVEFWGFALISQTLFSFCYAIGTTLYLIGRSCGTRKWYLSKFEDFPKNVKAIIPFIL